MNSAYDVIVVGAGSVGMPTAMALGEKGLRTLVVDMHPSPGQGENKHAIGGVWATHSVPGKILTCLRSLQILSTWKQMHGDDIEWLQGGYLYPVYREADADLLKKLLPLQKSYGCKIDFVGPQEVGSIVPGVNRDGCSAAPSPRRTAPCRRCWWPPPITAGPCTWGSSSGSRRRSALFSWTTAAPPG